MHAVLVHLEHPKLVCLSEALFMFFFPTFVINNKWILFPGVMSSQFTVNFMNADSASMNKLKEVCCKGFLCCQPCEVKLKIRL